MIIKSFNKTYLIEELDLPYEAIEDKIIDTLRWSAIHKIVFQDKDGSFWSTTYSCGLTELQDEHPWEYDGEKIECTKVEKRLIQIEDWVAIEEE